MTTAQKFYATEAQRLAVLATLAEEGGYVDGTLDGSQWTIAGDTPLAALLDLGAMGLLRVESGIWFTYYKVNEKGLALLEQMKALLSA